MQTPLIRLGGARFKAKPAKRPPSPKSFQWSKMTKRKGFENFTTLKRVCPSECQGAQGAFKDSMIH
jgi:hypothetical protein